MAGAATSWLATGSARHRQAGAPAAHKLLRRARQANGPDLATCALRPSGIFGEGDTVMVPTLVRQARAGKMKYIIGAGGVWGKGEGAAC